MASFGPFQNTDAALNATEVEGERQIKESHTMSHWCLVRRVAISDNLGTFVGKKQLRS